MIGASGEADIRTGKRRVFQDQVATSVAGVIGPALRDAEAHRSAHRPTNDLTAYDIYLRASAAARAVTENLGGLSPQRAMDPFSGSEKPATRAPASRRSGEPLAPLRARFAARRRPPVLRPGQRREHCLTVSS